MRSTKIAPDALSTSYLTGSASLGISMMTLISSGGFLPVGTRSRPMSCALEKPARADPRRWWGRAGYGKACCGAASRRPQRFALDGVPEAHGDERDQQQREGQAAGGRD